MSEEIIRDLINRLDAKMRKQMEDYIDLCNRADCDMEEATNHMLGLSIRIAVVGLISCVMILIPIVIEIAIVTIGMLSAAQKKIKARR